MSAIPSKREIAANVEAHLAAWAEVETIEWDGRIFNKASWHLVVLEADPTASDDAVFEQAWAEFLEIERAGGMN